MKLPLEAHRSLQYLAKMGRLRKSILIFIALCVYERSVYGTFAVLNDFSYNQYLFGLVLFLACVAFLSLEDSLGSLLAYSDNEEDNGDDDDGDNKSAGRSSERSTGSEVERPVFLFGAIDYDMLTLFSLPMSLTVGVYRIHVVRLLYYNLHGVLFTFAWCGLDSTIGWMVGEISGWKRGPRVALDILLLIIANCGLIVLHQISGQFGIKGSDADVIVEDKEKSEKSYSPPKTDRSDSIASSIEDEECREEQQLNSVSRMVYMISGMHSRVKQEIRERQDLHKIRLGYLRNRIRQSIPDKTKRQAKILLTFIFVTMFWSVIWDIFSSMPREHLTDEDDDTDEQDDYDKHDLSGHDTSFYIMSLGICYVIVSFAYLAITGELFAFVTTEDEPATASTSCATWIINNREMFMNIFPDSVIDKSYKCCGQNVRPFRIIDYNLKGMFSVIAWIGIIMIVISLEDHIIFNSVDDTYAARCLVYTMWFLVANVIFVCYDTLDDQFGGISDDKDRPVVEIISRSHVPGSASEFPATEMSGKVLNEPLLE